MRDARLRVVRHRAAELLELDLLAGDRLDHVGAGDEHVRGLLHHEDEVGHRGRVDGAAGARAHDQADLRDDAGALDVADEDVAVGAERDDALLDPRAARVVDADDRAADLGGQVHDLAHLLGHDLAERAAEDREVLAEDADRAAVDRAVAGDDGVAPGPVLLHVEVVRCGGGRTCRAPGTSPGRAASRSARGRSACPWRAASPPPRGSVCAACCAAPRAARASPRRSPGSSAAHEGGGLYGAARARRARTGGGAPGRASRARARGPRSSPVARRSSARAPAAGSGRLGLGLRFGLAAPARAAGPGLRRLRHGIGLGRGAPASVATASRACSMTVSTRSPSQPKRRARKPRRCAATVIGLKAGGVGSGSALGSLVAGRWLGLGLRLGLRLGLGLGLGLRLRLGLRLGRPATSTVNVTWVPQPEDSSSTLPFARSPSQTTLVSGSSRVMRISPNSPRWRARAAASLSSVHSSGGDFTSRRCACTWGIGGTIRPPPRPSCGCRRSFSRA